MKRRTTVDAPTRREAQKRPRPCLWHLHGPECGVVDAPAIALSVGRHVMGRDDDAGGLLVDDPRASRTHATLHVASRSFKVRIADEGSRHGTWVNGRQIKEVWLEDGDVVRIGDSHYLLRYDAHDLEDVELPGMIGRAPAMVLLRRTIHQVAKHDVTVMILGESGCGKELVARAIHDLSGRRGAFVALNCAAVPENLAESQLFGHVSGAFTGARDDHPGYFRAAHRGTLFLDEIGDMPLALQPKLLRALEQREVTPVGATEALSFDARVVVATHRDVAEEVDDERFRGDLYARLAQFELHVPTLHDRREDLLLLLHHGLAAHDGHLDGQSDGHSHAHSKVQLDADLVAALLQHDWPYNVRELFALAAELAVRADGDVHTLDKVAHRLARGDAGEAAPSKPSAGDARGTAPDRDTLEELVRTNNGNVRAIARATGRSRMQVYRWLEQYGIELADYRDAD